MLEDSITSKAVLREMAERIKQYRIKIELTQEELSIKCGVSLRSISRFEKGEDIQFSNLIKILQGLGLKDNIDLLVPDVTKYPSYYALPKKRQRVRKKTKEAPPFKWGDEK